MGKKPEFAAAYLDQLIEEATVDAYNESEQTVAFFTMIEEHLAFPFTTRVIGQEVTVAKVGITHRDQIVAVCSYRNVTEVIPLLELPMPSPPPPGAVWIEAYRRWFGE